MTVQVTIRPYVSSDAQALYDAASESYREIEPWMPWCHADYTLGEAESWIATTIDGRRNGTLFDFAVFADAQFAGACGINQINTQDRVANLGYWLRSSQTGKGIAIAGARQLIEWTFANTDLNRLEIVVAVGNHKSQRVAQKVGANREAVLAKRTMVAGVPSSAVLYSALRED